MVLFTMCIVWVFVKGKPANYKMLDIIWLLLRTNDLFVYECILCIYAKCNKCCQIHSKSICLFILIRII